MKADAATLSQLREALAAAGYSEARLAERFGIQGQLSPDERERPFHLRVLADGRPLSTLVKLFQLALPVDRDEAAAALAPASLEALADVGLLDLDDGVRGTAALHPIGDLFVASDWEREDRAPERQDHVLGPSAPSRSLVALTPREPVRSALDVGTGCGLQALEAARHSPGVVAVDVNPRALEFTRFNAVLNGLENVETREGSLFDPVEGERFDLIVCNPPYVVSPENEYVFRDSGLPGDSFCEALVRRMPQFLTDGAVGLALVSWVHGADDWTTPLRRWVDGSGCDAVLIRRHSLDPLAYASAWNRILALDPRTYEEALERWLAYYAELRIELIGWGAVVLRRGERGAASVTAIEVPVEPEPGAGAHVRRLLRGQELLASLDGDSLLETRLKLPEDHRIAQVLALRQGEANVEQSALRLVGGLPLEARLDLQALQLVAELDAGRTAREVLTEPASAVPALRQLIGLGLLVPAAGG
jgi:methylase of polypeptide subunit release factors